MIRHARRSVALVALAWVLAGCGAAPSMPAALGGLPQMHALQGEEAIREINRLHGKSVPSRDGFVAHYERDGAMAMLYVSQAYLAPIARWQFSRMVEGIRRGESSAEGRFFQLKVREEGGLTLYSAVGLGQVHYFYRSGARIVWLATDPEVAHRTLADVVRLVR